MLIASLINEKRNKVSALACLKIRMGPTTTSSTKSRTVQGALRKMVGIKEFQPLRIQVLILGPLDINIQRASAAPIRQMAVYRPEFLCERGKEQRWTVLLKASLREYVLGSRLSSCGLRASAGSFARLPWPIQAPNTNVTISSRIMFSLEETLQKWASLGKVKMPQLKSSLGQWERFKLNPKEN